MDPPMTAPIKVPTPPLSPALPMSARRPTAPPIVPPMPPRAENHVSRILKEAVGLFTWITGIFCDPFGVCSVQGWVSVSIAVITSNYRAQGLIGDGHTESAASGEARGTARHRGRQGFTLDDREAFKPPSGEQVAGDSLRRPRRFGVRLALTRAGKVREVWDSFPPHHPKGLLESVLSQLGISGPRPGEVPELGVFPDSQESLGVSRPSGGGCGAKQGAPPAKW
jgi:hypothetical protein